MIYYANLAIGMSHRTEQRSYGRICFLIHEPYTTGQGGKKQQKMRKSTFYLAISKKSRTFAHAFRKKFCLIWRKATRKVVWVVERAALEMRYTHYVVSGVRIPHFPLREKTCMFAGLFLLVIVTQKTHCVRSNYLRGTTQKFYDANKFDINWFRAF